MGFNEIIFCYFCKYLKIKCMNKFILACFNKILLSGFAVLALLFLSANKAIAQSSEGNKFLLSGVVVDETKKSLPGASVMLKSSVGSDSIVAVTNNLGHFDIATHSGEYTLLVSYIGYRKLETQIDGTDNVQLDTLMLQSDGATLQTVTVSASRIVYNSKGFKVNLQNEPLVQSFHFGDVMRMLPGITIQDGKLYANNKPVESLFVNNKKLRFTSDSYLEILDEYLGKEVKYVEVLDRTADPELATGSGVVLKITTTAVDDGGMLRLTYTNRDGNVYNNSSSFGALFRQRLGKWSIYVSPSYTPTNILTRHGITSTTYNSNGTSRNEYSTFKLNNSDKQGLRASLAYDFTKSTYLLVSATGSMLHKTISNASQNTLLEDGSEKTSNGEAVNKFKNKNLSGNVSFSSEGDKVTFTANVGLTMNNSRKNNTWRQSIDGQSAAQLMSHFTRYRLLSSDVTAKWKINKGQSATYSANYNYWNNPSDNTDADGDYYKFTYKQQSLTNSLSYSLQRSFYDITLGLNHNYIYIHPSMSGASSEGKHYDIFTPTANFNFTLSRRANAFINLEYQKDYSLPSLSFFDPGITYNSEYSYTVGKMNQKPSYTHTVSAQAKCYGWQLSFKGMFSKGQGYKQGFDSDANMEYMVVEDGTASTIIFANLSAPMWMLGKTFMLTASAGYRWDHYRAFGMENNYSGINCSLNVMGQLPGGVSLFAMVDASTKIATDLYGLSSRPLSGIINLNKTFLGGKLGAKLACNLEMKTKMTTVTYDYRQSRRFTQPRNAVSLSVWYTLDWGKKNAQVTTNRYSNSEALRAN